MGTHYHGSEAEIRALNTYIKLMRAAESVTSRINQHLSADKLTVSQFGVLEALYHLGPLCQSDLAQKILKSSGNITLVIDNLEKRGLVVRQRSQKDRRFVTVKLTGVGRALIESIFPRHVERVVQELSSLSADEQEELARLLRKLGKQTPESQGIR